MCKLMMMPNIPKGKSHLAWKYSIGCVPQMKSIDKDGVGYMAYAEDNDSIFGERWVDPKQAFRVREQLEQWEIEYSKTFQNAVDLPIMYNTFGQVGKEIRAIGLHTRMATCDVNIGNTHPFYDETNQTALIHNGVISNANAFKCASTCDSEAILVSYLKNGISGNPANFQKLSDELYGGMACGVITRSGENVYFDVWRNERSELYVAYVSRLETFVIATTPEIIRAGAAAIKSKVGQVIELNPEFFIRFNVMNSAEGVKVIQFTQKYGYRTTWESSAPTTTHQKDWWKKEDEKKDLEIREKLRAEAKQDRAELLGISDDMTQEDKEFYHDFETMSDEEFEKKHGILRAKDKSPDENLLEKEIKVMDDLEAVKQIQEKEYHDGYKVDVEQ